MLAWDVFAPSAGPESGALAGDYAGPTASATVGAGVGANALVGGSGRSFTLQPLSIQAQTGLALAAGVASMTLRAGSTGQDAVARFLSRASFGPGQPGPNVG